MKRDDAYRAAEETARYAYGRLVAYVARRARDLGAAEDAIADAFEAALERWPHDGVPANPEAWIMTAAIRRLTDRARRNATRERYAPMLLAAMTAAHDRSRDDATFPDERLEMLFACAHPAIDPSVRTPLVLRAVLGIDAARIASAFFVTPVAMRQRLVRAKNKIRDAGIAFAVPPEDGLDDRIDVVLDAIYVAFGLSWEDREAGGAASDLTREALWLAQAVATRLPQYGEAQGLLALVSFVEARRDARRDDAGRYVPLDDQDVRRWSPALVASAHGALARGRSPVRGRYAIEAEIQAAHVSRRLGGEARDATIAALYDELVAASGALGAAVSRAAAHARAFGDDAGLKILATLDPVRIAAYQPYWALRAHLTGTTADYDRAVALCDDAATRAFLVARRKRAAAH